MSKNVFTSLKAFAQKLDELSGFNLADFCPRDDGAVPLPGLYFIVGKATQGKSTLGWKITEHFRPGTFTGDDAAQALLRSEVREGVLKWKSKEADGVTLLGGEPEYAHSYGVLLDNIYKHMDSDTDIILVDSLKSSALWEQKLESGIDGTRLNRPSEQIWPGGVTAPMATAFEAMDMYAAARLKYVFAIFNPLLADSVQLRELLTSEVASCLSLDGAYPSRLRMSSIDDHRPILSKKDTSFTRSVLSWAAEHEPRRSGEYPDLRDFTEESTDDDE